ncbi:uncharacterized protein LOC132041652 isoform X3 [Lycium ferocissimum]|uniref:uncharacterized protein LOC132041652 isoform X3 n=1 Tax=Lycium ferocissimum TaxID=112874 RepID=UPI002814E84D|nr:uncharacterized protein LOC132041652 isoform X3 [Lycium ferocissimum]
MAIQKTHKGKTKPRSTTLILTVSIIAITLLYIGSNGFSFSTSISSKNSVYSKNSKLHNGPHKYLYWGNRIDCPGKHCNTCAGLGHQESSLRCALEEAMFLNRWADSSCAMDSLYDLDLISDTVPVILDNSEMWHHVLATSMKLGSRGVAHVEGVSKTDLKEKSSYSNILLINRTASPLSWFAECKNRKNHSSILLPYSFLPSMAAEKLRRAAEEIKVWLGDYDAMHVRRGDVLKTRKDRFGVERSLHPHLDRDTRPEFILCRIAKWVPPGRTLYIASNERTPGYFSPLGVRYKLAYSSNFSSILDPLIENNYELFMVERLIMMGAKTFINTMKQDDTDLSLSDDPKKNTKKWEIPVYTRDNDEC